MRKDLWIKRTVAVATAFMLAFGNSGTFAAQLENNPSGIKLEEAIATEDTMEENRGTIVSNLGTVGSNYGTVNANVGTVTNNYGTVFGNSGLIVNNYGMVSQNTGTINNNYGTSNAFGVQGGKVVNDWNRMTVVNPESLEFSIESTGNYHIFTTEAVLVITAGTATVTASAIGYELEAETDIAVELRQPSQYTFTVNYPEGGEITIKSGDRRLQRGEAIPEGTELDIVMNADDGFRCGGIIIVETPESTTEVIEPLEDSMVQGLPVENDDLAAIGNIQDTIEVWRLAVLPYFGGELSFDSYQWQRSKDLESDGYRYYSTEWEDIPGACGSELLVNAEDIYDPLTYDYVRDYRVIVTKDGQKYCPISMLESVYESELDVEEGDTGGQRVISIPLTDYCSEYTAKYTMSDATANIVCEFIPILSMEEGDTLLEFGSIKPEDGNVTPQAVVFKANPGNGREVVLKADIPLTFSSTGNIDFEYVSPAAVGYEAFTSGEVVLQDGESVTFLIRPKAISKDGVINGYSRIKSYLRETADESETAETDVFQSTVYIHLKVSVNRLRPVINTVTASAIIYGRSLGESVVTGTAIADGEPVTGTFILVNADMVPDVSTAEYEAEFIPDSEIIYERVSGIPVTVEVKPATLVVTTESITSKYTGAVVTAGGIYDGLVNDETLTFTVTGAQKDVGSSSNRYEIVWDGTAKETNYIVEEHIGTITVEAATQPEGESTGGGSTGGGSTGGGSTGGGSTGGGSTGGGYSGGGYSGGGYSGGGYSGGGYSGGGIPEITTGNEDESAAEEPASEDTEAGESEEASETEEITAEEPADTAAEEPVEKTPEEIAAEEAAALQKAEEERYNAGITIEGKIISDSNSNSEFKITSSTKRKTTVTYTGVTKSQRTVTIADVVTAGGVVYRITKVAGEALAGNGTVRTLIIGDNISVIGKSAFKKCSKLTKVTLGDNVTELSRSAFYSCKKLTSIEVNSKLTSIATNAFRQCTNLEKLDLPETLNHIGPTAFYGCKALKTLTINSTLLTADNISRGAFKGMSADTIIYVPKAKVKEYTKLFRAKGLNESVVIKAISKKKSN